MRDIYLCGFVNGGIRLYPRFIDEIWKRIPSTPICTPCSQMSTMIFKVAFSYVYRE